MRRFLKFIMNIFKTKHIEACHICKGNGYLKGLKQDWESEYISICPLCKTNDIINIKLTSDLGDILLLTLLYKIKLSTMKYNLIILKSNEYAIMELINVYIKDNGKLPNNMKITISE